MSELGSLPRFACDYDKRPISRRGFHDACVGVDDSAWDLVGVSTGTSSGFDCLDIDVAGGLGWLRGIWERLPPTKTHETRSGGRHLLFRHAEGLRCSAGRIAKGVDVRADGGYIIWWPRQNLRVLSDAEIAEWPEWLLELARKKPTLPAACKSNAGMGIDPCTTTLTHAAVSVNSEVSSRSNRTINLQARCKVILRQVEYAKRGERNRLLVRNGGWIEEPR
jgi:hypothetical protein